jgi:hypothetical protein
VTLLLTYSLFSTDLCIFFKITGYVQEEPRVRCFYNSLHQSTATRLLRQERQQEHEVILDIYYILYETKVEF